MVALKHYRTKIRQHGGSVKTPTLKGMAESARTATKSKVTWTDAKRVGRTVIDPRKWISGAVGLARGTATAGFGTTRVLGTAALQRIKGLGQSFKVASAKSALSAKVTKLTGVNTTTLDKYEQSRKNLEGLEAKKIALQRQGQDIVIDNTAIKALNEQIAAAEKHFTSMGTILKTSLSQRLPNSIPNKAEDSIFKALSNSLLAKKSKNNIAKSLANAFATKQRAEQQKLEGLRKEFNAAKTNTDRTNISAKIKAQTTALEEIGVKTKTGIFGKSYQTKGVANLQSRIERREGRRNRSSEKSSLATIGRKLKEVAASTAASASEGYRKSQNALGTGTLLSTKGISQLTKGLLYSLPKSLVKQSFSVIGEETSKIKFTTRYGTVHVGEIGRKILQSTMQVLGKQSSTANILNQMVDETEKITKTRAKIETDTNQLFNDSKKLNDKYTTAPVGVAETPEQKAFREKQAEIITNNLPKINKYREALDKQAKERIALSKLELKLPLATPLDAVDLKAQIRSKKEQLLNDMNAVTSTQSEVRNLIKNIGTGPAADEIRVLGNATENLNTTLREVNRSEQLLNVSVQTVTKAYKKNQANAANVTDTMLEGIKTKTNIDVSLLKNAPTPENFDTYINALNRVKDQLTSETDPAKRDALKNAEQLLSSNINMANTMLIVPGIAQTNVVKPPALVQAVPVLAAVPNAPALATAAGAPNPAAAVPVTVPNAPVPVPNAPAAAAVPSVVPTPNPAALAFQERVVSAAAPEATAQNPAAAPKLVANTSAAAPLVTNTSKPAATNLKAAALVQAPTGANAPTAGAAPVTVTVTTANPAGGPAVTAASAPAPAAVTNPAAAAALVQAPAVATVPNAPAPNPAVVPVAAPAVTVTTANPAVVPVEAVPTPADPKLAQAADKPVEAPAGASTDPQALKAAAAPAPKVETPEAAPKDTAATTAAAAALEAAELAGLGFTPGEGSAAGGGSRKLNKKHLKKSKKARVSKNKLHKRKSRKNTY